MFNLKEDPCKETENLIRIYLENEEEVVEDKIKIYPPCFANRYIRIETDNSYGFEIDKTGVRGTDIHYPWLLYKQHNDSHFLKLTKNFYIIIMTSTSKLSAIEIVGQFRVRVER